MRAFWSLRMALASVDETFSTREGARGAVREVEEGAGDALFTRLGTEGLLTGLSWGALCII